MSDNDNTPLYQESLVELKKLFEVAKAEAQKTILEELSPIVDQLINKEMFGNTVILEQEESLTIPSAKQDTLLDTNASNNIPGTAPLDASSSLPMDSMGTSTVPTDVTTQNTSNQPALPITSDANVAPITSNASLAIPIPGPDGKITIDLQALFETTPEGSEPNLAVTPSPMQGMSSAPNVNALSTSVPNPTDTLQTIETETQPVTVPAAPEEEKNNLSSTNTNLTEKFNNLIRSVEKEILVESLSTKDINKLQNKLFNIYEIAQQSKVNKDIPIAIIANGEVKLELLFEKLKKTKNQDNSYNRQATIKENSKMANKEFKSLKDFAMSLFEGVEPKSHNGFGDGDSVQQSVKNSMNGAAGEKASKAAQSNSDARPVKDPGKKESTKVGGASVTESTDEEMDVDKELQEMFNSLDETANADSEDEEKMTKKSIQNKLNAVKEEQNKLMKALRECEMGENHLHSSEPANVNIKISVDGPASVSTDEPSSDNKMLGLDTASDEDMEQDTDDEDLEQDTDDEDMDLDILPDTDTDTDTEEEEKPDFGGSEDDENELPKPEKKEMVSESFVSKENKKLRNQLAATQLMTARSLYVNKLLANYNLPTKTKQQIVEYIDSANSVEEAKVNFGKVKVFLDARAKAPKQLGTSSAPTSLQTKSVNTINENASPLLKLQIQPNRWMQLAGITKTKE